MNMDTTWVKKAGTTIQSYQTGKSYRNIDNGVYVFSVRAIDHVGNSSDYTSLYLLL